MQGRCVILTGPSAAGKTTICEALLKKIPGMTRFVTTTTRLPRHGEADGREYYFITEKKFKRDIKNNKFFEWDQHYGYFYGISKANFKKFIDNNSLVLMVINPTGAKTIKKLFPQSTVIFIYPGSIYELKKRLSFDQRGEDNLEERLNSIKKEITQAPYFDHRVINHDGELEETVNKIITILNIYMRMRVY